MIKMAVLNAAKIDFDNRLDFGPLTRLGEVVHYAASSPDEAIRRSAGQDVLITKEMPVDEELMHRLAPSVKLICEAGTGYNNIDLAAARARGIVVCNVPGYSTEAVAQLVTAFILNLSSSLSWQQLLNRRGELDHFFNGYQLPHFEIAGKILGVIGAGQIGRRVIQNATALGMKALVYTRTPQTFSESQAIAVSLDELLRQSDFISIHCPLTSETEGLLDGEKLALMKPSAYLINTARGRIIREADLIAALQQRKIAGAALDVQEIEPPARENPLFGMDNVILTPHIGWQCLESRQRLLGCLAANIAAFQSGRPVHMVN